MITTVLPSMWMDRQCGAVSLLVLFIVLAIIKKEELASKPSLRFGIALILAIAYVSSIGGSSNIVRTHSKMVFCRGLKHTVSSKLRDHFPLLAQGRACLS
ncbi:MAG: hypothetical protein ABI045_06245 [Flavobacteriales bacterium]